MRLVLLTDEGPRDVVLEVNAADATVGDVLDLLDSEAPGVATGGRFVPRDHTLDEAGLHDGATVSPASTAPTVEPTHTGPWLVSTGGLDAGRWWVLDGARATVGRDPSCDAALDNDTVSSRHAELRIGPAGTVEVADLGSTNGTWVDGQPVTSAVRLAPGQSLRLGAVTFAIVAERPPDAPAVARRPGTWTFNRPPRPAPPGPPDAVRLPEAARDVAPPHGLGWASMLTPIVMAVAMVVVFDNPMFALFAVISPLTIVASWWESRRRGKTDRSREATRRAEDLDRFRTEVRRSVTQDERQRRDRAPHLAEVARRAEQPSVRLWERRPTHGDAFVVGVGTADLHSRPPLADNGSPDDEAAAILAEVGALRDAVLPIDLADGGVVGIVGPRAAAVAVARSVALQLVVHHGPADLRATVLVDDDRRPDWAWAGWLPHARGDRDRDRDRIVVGRDAADRNAEAWLAAPAAGPVHLVVVDAEGLTEGRRAPVRSVLNGEAGPVVGIVVATSADRLPAACRHVVELRDEDGTAEVRTPGEGATTEVLAWGLAADRAREVARALARVEDAELADAASSLPSTVTLPTLLPPALSDADTTLAHWRARSADPGLRVPVGVGPDGPLWLDLVTDGPHALVGGTTGSGKSELLRSLVVGAAAQVDPEHLNIVLIDYKGGSAFDVCADLPHTVGVVTDLDEHLGARALRCLEAELHHRESVLRAAGATDLPGYLRLPVAASAPLPRLLVVIDEFATVAAELPDFLDALVGIAQRGRSLGVHLVLATQRPSGVINDNIRANTNLRIALRVQDDADAVDVVGVNEPARIPRDLPGRAYVRLGPGEVVPVQTAYASGHTAADGARVRLRPVPGEPSLAGIVAPEESRGTDAADATDLERIVAVIAEADARGGFAEPRTPWPDPLPGDLGLAELRPAGDSPAPPEHPVATVALLDDPDRQRQVPVGWDPTAGNLLVFGIAGSGTTTTLASIALSLAETTSPDDLHLYVLDAGRGELRPLADLPHVGAVITTDEQERARRLIRHLARTVDQRRAAADRSGPRVVLLLDGYGAFTSAFDDHADSEVMDALERVIAEGPGVGVHVAASAARAGDVPGAVLSGVAQRWIHRLADAYDLSAFGVSPSAVPDLPPGRVVLAATQGLAQVARVPDLAAAVETVAMATVQPVGGPVAIDRLPERVAPATVGAIEVGPTLQLPLGIADDDLGVAGVTLHAGEHLLVAGPARSGRSSVLLAIAQLAADAGLPTATVASHRSPLREGPGSTLELADVPGWVEAQDGDAMLLVDDADLLDDADGALTRLAKDPDGRVRLIVAGRSDALRSAYGHWTADVRRSRTGLLLMPDLDLDGDLLGTRLPRRSPVPARVGSGWLVDPSGVRFVQAVQAAAATA